MNFYEVLNVSTNATEKEIKKAYRILAKKYHPDTYKGDKEFAEDKMQEINVAYDTLSNPSLKKKYDETNGFNVINNYRTTNTSSYTKYTTNNYSTTYKRSNPYNNRYNKSGVNYNVKYKPNNKKVEYDKDGYAASNYYTSETHHTYTRPTESIKDKLTRKNITNIIIILFIATTLVTYIGGKAIDSINELKRSTDHIYNRNIEPKPIESNIPKHPTNHTTNNEIEKESFTKDELKPFLKDKFNNIKAEGKERVDEYKKKKESKTKEETLEEWGITDKSDQKKILDMIERMKDNN